MAGPRVLCIVLAGGAGGRLGPLTTGRAKPSLPVGGTHRLIDVAMSNVAHSGLVDVWVLQQYEPHLLNEHLAGGRPWDLDRTRGGFRLLPPFEPGTSSNRDGGFADGNADALVQNWPVIDAFGPDVLVVMSADHLLRLDLSEVVRAHLDADADALIVTTTLPRDGDPTRHLAVHETGGRLRDFAYKPDSWNGRVVATEVFAYRPAALAEALRDLATADEPIGDYGERLLPHLDANGTLAAFRHEGHWRDLGTPESYLDGQLELLRERSPFRLDDPDWPILTSMPVRAPALVTRTAELDRAWVAPGAAVEGTVIDSIIGPGARVERGAEVRHAVVMADAVVRAGATVSRAVLAEHVDVGRRAVIGAPNARRPVLVGARRRIRAGTRVAAGSELEPVRPRNLLGTTR